MRGREEEGEGDEEDEEERDGVKVIYRIPLPAANVSTTAARKT